MSYFDFVDFFSKYNINTTKSAGFPRRVMDISLARESINYNPSTSLVDGLKETWEWFKENQDQYKKSIHHDLLLFYQWKIVVFLAL